MVYKVFDSSQVEGHTAEFPELVYEVQSPETASVTNFSLTTLPNHHRIRVIRPLHPDLVTSEISKSNILPYSYWSGAMVTIDSNYSCTYKGEIEGNKKAAWTRAVNRKLRSM
ncbi:hypothetical protein O181_120713 [Austropuccinia psidii MF-1]|uniref:Uncharacterized protein n=1 Tax=Austropuccinia psidii MF-1 TaxID=1389203 RepID=A0A9Q3Q0L1_9BASI|nr:hypothetical protein [Austropuccinia psidii MF-1]